MVLAVFSTSSIIHTLVKSSAAQSSCVSVGVGVSTVCESSAAIAVDVCDGEGYCSLLVYLCLLEETMNE